MAEKSNVKPSTMWSSKPVKMKLFGAWEIDKTPPDCIPRLCSLNINRLSWTPSMRQDVTAIIVAVKMQNSKRILRSNEIAIALPSHTSDSPASADIELDLSFTLQYPHFLKRNCNYLQIILQRRKKYKNKAILGFKTLACGVIDMAEVLQRSTIVEKDIDLIGHVKESGKNENLARITISTLRSQPIDQDSNLRRGKVSIDRPDVYSDEDDFTSAEDGSDSETIEEGNARDRMNHFRRKVNSRKPRKLFSGNDKFQSGVPSNVQQRNLKQKFISLLKKFRLPDSEGVYDSEEKFQEALEKELMSSNQEPADIDEYFDDDDIDELDYMSDSGQEFDDVSISSTPKPSLRPFFSSCTLVGQDKPEEQFPAFQGKKPFDNDSQENSGAEQTPDTSDTSQKHTEPQEPVSLKKSEETKKKAVNDKEVKRVKLFPTAKDKENKSQPKERKQPVSNSLSLTSASMSKDDSSPKEFILEQLNKVFSSDEHNIPDEILFINMAECAQAALLMAVFERTHHIIGTNTLSDVKFSFTFLCNKIQKFCNSNLKTPIPIKLALIGSEAYVNSFLRIYVDLLSSKSPDWQTYLRFYLIPASFINSSSPASSSPLHKYLASIDPAYAGYFHTSKDSVESSRDAGGSSEAAAASSAGAVAGSSGGAGGSLVSVQELYSKVVNYLNGAQTLLQIPIAEAMVTYKDKTGEDEPSQVFIPFISDAKIVMRLGKKKEKENESKCQVVEGICRLVCSYKATQSPIKVNIDGVELTGVKFFQLTTQWQTQIKFFPLVIFSTPDSFAVNSSPFGNSSNNYKMLK
ncbi:PREDICTED: phosphofurin acidic cluster sorting protein 1-like [Rhagoletis zephyria]|uniref:phosphofurin acidic cluster sorting protein 1-like n=1 Tax=Rhagoletis zephyria TaxID=28612 RepID=UPI00081157EB|nr:PREDICTED: phosphofurin acidic cluster sorting protein 1-like [Rhagoletis zephyria]